MNIEKEIYKLKEDVEFLKKELKTQRIGVTYEEDFENFPVEFQNQIIQYKKEKAILEEYYANTELEKKVCKNCNLEKNKLEFQRRKNNKDKYDTICKNCRRHKQEESNLKHIRKYGY